MNMVVDTSNHTRATLVSDAGVHLPRGRAVEGRPTELAPQDALVGWTVLLYDSSDSETVMLRSWVDSIGGTVIRLRKMSDAWPFIERNRGARIALLLEVHSEDLEDRVDECLDLRARFPECPIILMSETFGMNDFSTDRMAICDASLRSPVSQVAFKLAIPAVFANHREFMARRAVRQPEPQAVVQPRAEAPAPVRARRVAIPERPVAQKRAPWWSVRMEDFGITYGVGVMLSVGFVLMFAG